jgi:hypothetical protein
MDYFPILYHSPPPWHRSPCSPGQREGAQQVREQQQHPAQVRGGDDGGEQPRVVAVVEHHRLQRVLRHLRYSGCKKLGNR